MKPITEIAKQRKPTRKQMEFAKAYVQTNNAAEAARQAKYNGSKQTIQAIATENLSKPTIQALIKDMKQQFVTDSYTAYQIQKEIMNQSSKDPYQWELTNKIANKILDRAGFMPVAKQENKSISMRYVISRGKSDNSEDDTAVNLQTNASTEAS